jgi:hypothetical protein
MSTATINFAIVSDPTGNNAREARRVSETRATAPEFPPGRYGRRRDGRRHLLGPAVILAVVLVICVFLAVRLYRQYGDPAYDSQIVGWSDVTATQMRIKFTVNVPAGGAASCILRARDYNGTEVGRRTVTVRSTGGATTVTADELVTTTARASAGDVLRCSAAG